MERAMLRIYNLKIPVDECRMLLQIHDEIVFEIREDLTEYYTPILAEAMSRVDYHPNFTHVKFAAKPSKWGEK
jgi:DNA polymerase I-like protein with 3'-5' exonuclease and polymerase domains